MPLSPRQEAVRLAKMFLHARPVFLDTETTGTHSSAEIIEISILDHNGSVLLDTLVRPRYSIPADATRIHKIDNAMVQNAPSWDEVWPRVLSLLRDRSVGIYNADFDLRLMRQSHQAHSLLWEKPAFRPFCIMKLYAQYYGQRGSYGDFKWHKLEAAGRRCQIPLPNSHRAKDDTLLARAVLEYMANH